MGPYNIDHKNLQPRRNQVIGGAGQKNNGRISFKMPWII